MCFVQITLFLVNSTMMQAHGASGIIGIARKFRIADDDNSGTISAAEFHKVITEHNLGWTSAQEKAVFDFFDRNKNGCIEYDEFLRGLRGALNERRSQLVLQAFQVCVRNLIQIDYFKTFFLRRFWTLTNLAWLNSMIFWPSMTVRSILMSYLANAPMKKF